MRIWMILVAAIAAHLIGWAWYGPLFGKKWQKLTGMTDAKIKNANMGVIMGLTLVGAILTAAVLSFVITAAGMKSPLLGPLAAVIMWLGFVAPNYLHRVLYEQSSWSLWLINAGYALVTMLVMGIILGAW